jgi:hypothetical protein
VASERITGLIGQISLAHSHPLEALGQGMRGEQAGMGAADHHGVAPAWPGQRPPNKLHPEYGLYFTTYALNPSTAALRVAVRTASYTRKGSNSAKRSSLDRRSASQAGAMCDHRQQAGRERCGWLVRKSLLGLEPPPDEDQGVPTAESGSTSTPTLPTDERGARDHGMRSRV